MNVLTRSSRRASLRALVGVTAVALTAGAALAPTAAQAANVPAPLGQIGLYGAGFPNYDAVYRQSLAILGLHAAGEDVDPRAVTWLLDQQCGNNGFSSFNPNPDDECRSFDSNPATYGGGTDTNATALAVQALEAVGENEAADAAAGYLAGVQNADGGWDYTPEAPGAASDANSTGLVLTALNATTGSATTAVDDAAEYFAAHQVGRPGVPLKTPGDEGGIVVPGEYGSNGYGNDVATAQLVPGLLGEDLVDVPSPALSGWDRAATPVPSVPAADPNGVATWATEWLESAALQDAIEDGSTAWTILSFASTATARVAAQDLYETVRTGVPTSNPGALGQAALAATALGETADAQRFASLIAATLTTAVGRDAAASTKHATSLSSSWVNQPVTVSNPYAGSDPDLNLTQTVIWGDGTTTPLTAATASHAYPTAGTYRPRVRVEVSGFVRPGYVDLGSVTVVKPNATLKLSKSTAWAGASITLTKSAVTGSPSNVTVAWGDGTRSNVTSVASAAHTYKNAGTFTPTVTLVNGTGGTRSLSTAPATVKVTKDTGKPTVTLKTPTSKTKVSSWRTLRGTATDSGIGVKTVTVKLVEKRSGAWYSYNGKSWTKRSTYKKALSSAKQLTLSPSAKGAWSLKVAKLTKGTLKVSYSAVDKAGNRSSVKLATGSLKK